MSIAEVQASPQLFHLRFELSHAVSDIKTVLHIFETLCHHAGQLFLSLINAGDEAGFCPCKPLGEILFGRQAFQVALGGEALYDLIKIFLGELVAASFQFARTLSRGFRDLRFGLENALK
jgi:hypothetical protein